MKLYWGMVSVNLFFLIIWFKTDAFLEYMKLMRVHRWFFIDDFENKKSEDFELTYHLYLRQYRNCFLSRLVTCPICLTTWMFIVLIVFDTFSNFSLNVIVTLSLYYLFSKLMR